MCTGHHGRSLASTGGGRRLACDGDTHSTWRVATAENTTCGSALLEKFAADPDDRVRAAAAANANTSPELLERLAGYQISSVRAAAVADDTLPAQLLRWLLHDSDPLTATAAAQAWTAGNGNPNATGSC